MHPQIVIGILNLLVLIIAENTREHYFFQGKGLKMRIMRALN